MRARFEARVAALPVGAIDRATGAQLQREFGGVIAAYSPAQWERLVGARGLSAESMREPASADVS